MLTGFKSTCLVLTSESRCGAISSHLSGIFLLRYSTFISNSTSLKSNSSFFSKKSLPYFFFKYISFKILYHSTSTKSSFLFFFFFHPLNVLFSHQVSYPNMSFTWPFQRELLLSYHSPTPNSSSSPVPPRQSLHSTWTLYPKLALVLSLCDYALIVEYNMPIDILKFFPHEVPHV